MTMSPCKTLINNEVLENLRWILCRCGASALHLSFCPVTFSTEIYTLPSDQGSKVGRALCNFYTYLYIFLRMSLPGQERSWYHQLVNLQIFRFRLLLFIIIYDNIIIKIRRLVNWGVPIKTWSAFSLLKSVVLCAHLVLIEATKICKMSNLIRCFFGPRLYRRHKEGNIPVSILQ